MPGLLATLKALMEARAYYESWARFQEWRKKRKSADVKKAGVILLAAYLATGATCATDYRDFCREFPWEKVCGGKGEKPTPAPTPTPTPAVTPTATPCPPETVTMYNQLTGERVCVTPVPTRTPTAVPTDVPTAPPTPTPTPVCAPRPGPTPVTLAWINRCPRYMEPLHFEGEGLVTPPEGIKYCGLAQGEGNHRTAWRIGYHMARLHEGQFRLAKMGNALVMEELGSRPGCVDAYGRWFPNCAEIYPSGPPEYYPHGERGVYEVAGYHYPTLCEDLPPAPRPTPTLGPPVVGCAVVEEMAHFMAPGNSCHAWQKEGGQIRCLVDSTIRPICDLAHLDNWNTMCGGRSHDPDYDSPSGAQIWTIEGAEDRGPHSSNSAQRWIVGPPGGQVKVTVCIRPDAKTPDGCRITRRGDGCGVREFILPAGE